MAKKKNISSSAIIDLYMDYILEHSKQPNSVYAFAKANNFEEAKFYDFFGSFEALETTIFKRFFDNTLQALNNSEDYQSFTTRHKLLSFYFTFFENLTANRSFVIHMLNGSKQSLKNLKVLTKLKHSFTNYINNLDIELIDFEQEQIKRIQNKGIKESAWLQLLLTIKFWMDDTSPNFEKTDIYIEKSVNTTFDILDVTPLKSIIDLGKFLYKEKIRTNEVN